MKNLLILLILVYSTILFSQVGVATETPQKTLHVNGSLQITNELNVGGNATTEGNAGTRGQVLTSQGSENSPQWTSLSNATGTLYRINYLKGTSAIIVNQNVTSIIPGLTYTITVPNTVTSQTLSFIITGYASNNTGTYVQGVFSLYKGNSKLTSAYSSVAGEGAGLNNLPIPVTLMFQETILPGTYTYTVRYKSWRSAARINYNPYPTYSGSDALDNEAMLTKMQIMVFNN